MGMDESHDEGDVGMAPFASRIEEAQQVERTTRRPRRHPRILRARLVLASPFVAIAVLTAAWGSSPGASSRAGFLISQGFQAEAAGNTQQAAQDFRSAAAIGPKDAEADFE